MKERTSLPILKNIKNYKVILWTIVCQQIRWNGWIPRKTQTTETDSRRNRKSK